MKVFLSSVVTGFEEFRDAASAAARSLAHDVKRSEDFAASPESPQAACLGGVRWANVVVLLLGARYGHRQPSGLSATHEEYREAKDRCAILAFEQRGIDVEPEQEVFLREVKEWTGGALTASFGSADELRDAVTRALRDLELARAVGPVDEPEMLQRVEELLPDTHRVHQPSLSLVVVGGPRQQIIRPVELEEAALELAIAREALFGESPVLDRSKGTNNRVIADALLVEQDGASVLLDQLGSVRVVQPARREQARSGPVEVPVLIQEDVHDAITRALTFSAWLLDHVDPVRRLSDVVVVAALDRAGLGWRTRVEHEREPNTISGMFIDERAVARLSPPRRHRAALTQSGLEIAVDLTVLLRRALVR